MPTTDRGQRPGGPLGQPNAAGPMMSWPQRGLLVVVLALLGLTAMHVGQLTRASRAAVEATTATQTTTSLIGFTQRESLNSIVAIDQWLAGGSSRRDLQIARALLARRLSTADEQGRTAGELAGDAYMAALNDLDSTLTTAPPGVLSPETRSEFREQLGPKVIRFSDEAKHLSDVYQRYSDQVLQETSVNVQTENRHVVISLLVTFATVAVLLVWMTRDIRRRYERAAEMDYRATHDSLTGLVNRASLLERVHAAVRRADPTASLALVFIDLDGFKQVNDDLGHEAGDQVLVATAARLAELVDDEPSRTAARLGGDEFVVLCERLVDPANVERLAGELVAALARPIDVDGTPVTIGASVGISVADPATTTVEQMMRQADVAMYRAKRAGAGRFHVFDRAQDSEDDLTEARQQRAVRD